VKFVYLRVMYKCTGSGNGIHRDYASKPCTAPYFATYSLENAKHRINVVE